MVTLIPISETDYNAWFDNLVREYAAEKVKAGNWPEEGSLQRSIEETKRLLPDGPSSKDAYLFTVLDRETHEKVGVIWFSVISEPPPRAAFIYDFLIYEPYRRKGYGAQAMLAVEEKVQEQGVDTISLHVFGHNLPARRLYEKVGYEVTNVIMTKKI